MAFNDITQGNNGKFRAKVGPDACEDRCAIKDYTSEFARRLAARQRPLVEPFSTILRDNLWDLYVRS